MPPIENLARQLMALLGQLVEAVGSQIRSITLGKPTLEDVFIDLMGRSTARRQ